MRQTKERTSMYNATSSNDHKQKTAIRANIIGSLIALSVTLLAIFHSDNKILGLEIIRESFAENIINFIKLALGFSIFSGTIFIITVGYFNGFNYSENYQSNIKFIQSLVSRWHKFIAWSHKKSYNCTIGTFILSFAAIVISIIAKILGIYGAISVIITAAITIIIMLIIITPILINKFKRHDKKS